MGDFFVKLKEEKISNQFMVDNGLEAEIFKQLTGHEVIGGEFIEGKFKEYDRITRFAKHPDVTSEWKLDKACREYGNAIIEFWCRGESSGIKATKSDYWWHAVFSKKYPGILRISIWDSKELLKLVENVRKLPKLKWPWWYGGVANIGDWDRDMNMRAAMGYKIKEEYFFDTKNCLCEKQINLKEFIQGTGVEHYVTSKKRS